MLFLDLLAVEDVDTSLKLTSFNAHTTYLLDESALTYSITAADLNVFSFFFTGKLSENLVYLFPSPVHTARIAFELEVYVMRLSETGR
jgi:hypothetical protein